jgi:hypothetical protein
VSGINEVSILIATVGAVGRYRGAPPRSKVSMMIMRPPHGQGCASAGASSVAAASSAAYHAGELCRPNRVVLANPIVKAFGK